MAAQHYAVWTISDYSDEKSSFKLYNGAVTPTSISGYVTDLGTMRTAIQNLVLGTVASEMWIGDNTAISQARPTDPDAQRERKGLIVYKGNTNNKLFTATLPTIRTKTAGGASLIIAGTDKFDLAAPLVAPFVSDFQSLARTPDSDLETVTIVEIRLVGRNI